MPLILFLFFVIIPIIEITLFIYVGDAIGIAATLALVIITAIIGTWLLNLQGFAALERTKLALAEGRAPVDSVIDGVCLLLAGAFLLTPGFLTDGLGFLLFVPQFRRWLAKSLVQRLMRSSNVEFSVFGLDPEDQHNPPPGGHGRGGRGEGPIIDLEAETVEPRKPSSVPESGGSEGPGKKKSHNSPWQKPRS